MYLYRFVLPLNSFIHLGILALLIAPILSGKLKDGSTGSPNRMSHHSNGPSGNGSTGSPNRMSHHSNGIEIPTRISTFISRFSYSFYFISTLCLLSVWFFQCCKQHKVHFEVNDISDVSTGEIETIRGDEAPQNNDFALDLVEGVNLVLHFQRNVIRREERRLQNHPYLRPENRHRHQHPPLGRDNARGNAARLVVPNQGQGDQNYPQLFPYDLPVIENQNDVMPVLVEEPPKDPRD